MKKYEFHIGDYVETKDGKIGYIENITKDPDGTVDIIVVNLATCSRTYKIYNCRKICNTNTNYPSSNMEDGFNRIGKYDFTKPQKENKIEPLNIEVKYEQKSCDKVTTYANGDLDIKINTNENIVTGIKDIPNYDIYSKINEIINYINSKED